MLAWVAFAAYLNLTIVRLNRPFATNASGKDIPNTLSVIC